MRRGKRKGQKRKEGGGRGEERKMRRVAKWEGGEGGEEGWGEG